MMKRTYACFMHPLVPWAAAALALSTIAYCVYTARALGHIPQPFYTPPVSMATIFPPEK